MKLSEAIRLGSLLGPQLFGILHNDAGGTCAWGAALVAVSHFRWDRGFVMGIWPWVLSDISPCPADNCDKQHRAYYMIVHLNNDHRWTREHIADWIATIELVETAPVDREEESYVEVV